MKLFGWKSAGRDESRPALDGRRASMFGDAPGHVPQSYRAQVQALYLRNAIAQRAVRMIAEGVGEAPLAAAPELLALVQARSGGQALTATLAAQVLLHGNAYVQVLTDAGGHVRQLFALRPDRVRVEPDAGGWPTAYRYTVGQVSTLLDAEEPRPQIVHLKAFHPLDDHYGLGCLGAAAAAIALHNAAAAWNTGLLDNAARPSGALVYDPGDGSTLSRDQFERLFGTMRIGGCIIWSTDLIESKATSSGGKGQPSTTSYSYSASFAVALSGRPIVGVGRIWADGNLLRGSSGDFKGSTGFRLHLGDEGQGVDPLIASAEGAGLTSAHRGIAYAVFEHFQLADYGNRIPSLTFEVIGDASPVPVGAIAAALSDGAIAGSDVTLPLAGFAAYGDSVRGVVETLAVAGGAWFAPEGSALRMRGGASPDAALADGETVAAGSSRSKHGRAIAALETVPRQVTLAYYDPARDYQTGSQRARRPGAGVREDRVEMPAAIDAGTAKTMAEAVLSRAEAGRERRTVTLGWDAIRVVPGACVTIADVPGVWRVTAWALEHMVLSLECVRLAAGTLDIAASAGRVLSAPDLAVGTTVLAAFEGLPLDDSVLTTPRVTVVAAGTQPGWRRAAVLYSVDGGANWTGAGSTALPGTIGQLVTVPAAGSSAIVDRATRFDVELTHAAMTLEGADPDRLDAGANLALVGGELLQFGIAEQLGATRWRLSDLLRGRRGTEAAIGGQAVGDRFVLVEAESALSIDLPISALLADVRIMASGPGDVDGPVEAVVPVSGASVLPPSPVHLAWSELGNGDVAVQWTRRSRNGWRWIDGVDAPLGEERELYRIVLRRSDGTTTTLETAVPTILVPQARRGGGVTVAVRQVGSYGESPSVTGEIPSWTS